MTQLVKCALPLHLLLRETPKASVHISSGFAIRDKDIIGWRAFYQLCHSLLLQVPSFVSIAGEMGPMGVNISLQWEILLQVVSAFFRKHC
jgi:hypothetical protein